MQNKEFKIQIPITRAYYDENGQMMFEGTASSTSVDSHETIFNENAQLGFKEDIENGMARGEPVELESEHNGDEEPMNVLGPVVSAEVINNKELKIIARLDPDNPKAVYYFNKMTRKDPITGKTKQFGLSINGYVVDANYEFNEELQKTIRVFNRVKLRRVGIVRKPSNPDSWIDKIIRSVEWEKQGTNESNVNNDTVNPESDTEIKERSIEMSDKPEVKEVAEVAVNEARNAENDVTHADATPETVSDSEPTEEANREEVADAGEQSAEVVADVNGENAERTEAEDEKVEKLDRASYWTGLSLINALSCVLDAITTLEEISEYDSEQVNKGMTEDAIKMGKECFAKLQMVLGDHVMNTEERAERALDAANTADNQREDLDDKITNTDGDENVDADAERANPAPEGPNMDTVIAAVSDYLKNDFTDSMTRKFQEMLDNAVNEKFGELNDKNEELRNQISTLVTEKNELVDRLAKVEAEPATKPGAQLITRSEEEITEKEQNLKRAKEENDVQEIIRHQIFGNGYIGYGKHVKV